MRIALIADIHGNLVALDAVLAELSGEQIDQIVCLGDVAVLGPQPREVIARLRDLACPCVLGNTDAWLIPESPLPVDCPSPGLMTDLTRWTADCLGQAEFDFLRRMRPTFDVNLSLGFGLRCFHASPRSLDDVIAATAPAAELAGMGIADHAAIYAGGHTHIQLVRRHGDAHIINPGSVGLPGVGPGGPDLPVNHAVAWVEYAVISDTDSGFTVTLRRLSLDLDRVKAAAVSSAMPHLKWWLSKWQ